MVSKVTELVEVTSQEMAHYFQGEPKKCDAEMRLNQMAGL